MGKETGVKLKIETGTSEDATESLNPTQSELNGWKDAYTHYSNKIKKKAAPHWNRLHKLKWVHKVHDLHVSRTTDVVVGYLMIIGVLLSLYSMMIGGVIIGAILGAYFAKPIVSVFKNIKSHISFHGKFKSLLFCAFGLTLLIAAPTLVAAAAVAVGVTYMVRNK